MINKIHHNCLLHFLSLTLQSIHHQHQRNRFEDKSSTSSVIDVGELTTFANLASCSKKTDFLFLFMTVIRQQFRTFKVEQKKSRDQTLVFS